MVHFQVKWLIERYLNKDELLSEALIAQKQLKYCFPSSYYFLM